MTIASIVSSFIGLIQKLIPVVALLAIVVFFIGILQYLYFSSQGKKDGPKGIMLWGIVALFVTFSLWGILSVIKQILIPPGY